MPRILCIESSGAWCSVGLVGEGSVKEWITKEDRAHSVRLAPMVNEVLLEIGGVESLDAIAVCSGPGSYTGLRIGVALAKGLCFGSDLPLLSVDAMKVLWRDARDMVDQKALFIPMIDARRMEVYTQSLNDKGEPLDEIRPLVLKEDSFQKELEEGNVVFFGSGSEKFNQLVKSHENTFFLEGLEPRARAMEEIVLNKFDHQQFEDLAYFEPMYVKEFLFHKSKPLI